MKTKEYLLILALLLFISILFVPIENSNMALGIGFAGVVVLLIYFLIRKK